MALLRLRDDKLQSRDIPILKAFCDAPANTLTATKLAKSAVERLERVEPSFRDACPRLGKALGYQPTKRKDGSTRWWESAAIGSVEDQIRCCE